MTNRERLASTALGLLGACVGGALGFWVFGLALQRNLYALVVPGGFLGIGCGLLARHPSIVRGAACGVAGLVLGLFSEWWYRPFVRDSSLIYFLGNIHQLEGGFITWGMLAIGALAAYWLGRDAALGRSGP